MTKISRRRFIRNILLGTVSTTVTASAYTRLWEPEWLELKTYPIQLSRKTSGTTIRVVHLSDLHASSTVPFELLEEAVKMSVESEPDLICLTGDYVTRKIPDATTYSRVLRPLSETAPTFASFGNHDGGYWARRKGGYETTDEVHAVLRNAGITAMINERQEVVFGDKKLLVVGMGDKWSRVLSPKQAFYELDNTDIDATIVLSHNPDSKTELADYPWDLMLSGHTHGGQVKIPFVGPPVVPVSDRRYVEGLCEFEGRWIHITPGVGNILGVRFNCRPQVSVLDLKI